MMEDIKCLIKKWGILFLILLISVLFWGLHFGKKQNKQKDIVEETWEPSVLVSDNRIETETAQEAETIQENTTESSLWIYPQAEDSLINEEEKENIQSEVLAAAWNVNEIYKEIEIEDGPSYASNISNFTKEQCEEVVTLLGEAGYVSITGDSDMKHYEKVEEFYLNYQHQKDAVVTIFDVHKDGLLGTMTFIYRQNRIQTYYVGIRWEKGGNPVLGDMLISDIDEIKLTEKSYFIYAYKELIEHSSLRQYWRIKPLTEDCKELTQKYVSGLDYQMYNILVTDWNYENVESVLIPGLFDDLYRIYTGENFESKDDKIQSDIFEKVMMTYLPVTVEQLKAHYQYDETTKSYQYDQIYASPYPPFGEVVDYAYHTDGTITLYVDGIWPDFNSDYAFTNEIVVQPFSDGTFRYISNMIEKKELDLPPIARGK